MKIDSLRKSLFMVLGQIIFKIIFYYRLVRNVSRWSGPNFYEILNSATCACVEITSIQKSFFNLVFPFYCQFQKNSIKSHHQTFVIWDVLLIFLLIKPRKRKFSKHPSRRRCEWGCFPEVKPKGYCNKSRLLSFDVT